MTNSISGIPTTRVSDLFVRDRLLNQVQYDQAELLRIQTQLSTGHRFDIPSDDPVAAARVASLQALLQRKSQLTANVATNQSYLSATDSAMSNIWGLVSDARATTIGVLGTTSTDTQRQAAAQQIDQILVQLLDTGNQNFRGRYLFAGSESATRPFQSVAEKYVEYDGNENRLMSYADIGQLFATNVTGSEVFGAISHAVRGSSNLTPVLTYETRLADLRGGQGIARGSISISDGHNASIVDFSQAETVGDLAAMIKAHAPANRTVSVDIDANTLVIRIDPMLGLSTNLSIREVGGGSTADELGIRRDMGVGDNPIESRDLRPVLRNTTPLADILGSRARAAVHSAGTDNDLIVQADAPGDHLGDGAPLNGVRVSFVDDPTVVAGREWVDYAGGDSLVVHVQKNYTNAKNVRDAVNARHALGTLPFTAAIDPLDDKRGGLGIIEVDAAATTRDGAGIAFDQMSGLQIVNRGQTFIVSLATAQTVEDVLNILNGSGAGVLAAINDAGNGIDLRSRVSGCDFTIGENGGSTAAQLGLRTFTANTQLDDLNFGRGVDNSPDYTGTKATATCSSTDNNSKLVFTARNPGFDWNDFTISFTDTAGDPSVSYDLAHRTLEFAIHASATTANEVMTLFQNSPAELRNAFQVSLGGNDDGTANNGAGRVDVGLETTAGGDSGIDFYITRADGVKLAIDVAGAKTVGDILGKINGNINNTDHALVADLSKYGNGIELTDASQGEDPLAVTRNPMSRAAIDLGLVPVDQDSSAAAAPQGTPTITVASAAAKSRLIFTAKDVGGGANGVRIVFQNGAPAGPVYDDATKTLTFGITAGTTKASDIVLRLGLSPYADRFAVAYDPTDTSHNDGTGLVGFGPAFAPSTAEGSASTYSTATVRLDGPDNDLIFTAKELGTSFDGTEIKFVEEAGGPPWAHVASYVRGTELVFHYDPTATANDIIDALEISAAKDEFAASLDPADASPNQGEGAVDATTISVPSTARQSGLLLTIKDPAQVRSDVRIVFQSGAPAGPHYDAAANTLTFGITPGVTTAQDIVASMAGTPEDALFSLAYDPANTSGNNGSRQVDVLANPLFLKGGCIGGYAAATAEFAGTDNDLIVRARGAGTALNDTQIIFNAVPGGPLSIVSDLEHHTLTVNFDSNPGGTTAQQVVDAFAGNADFVVTLDPADASPNNGEGAVDATEAAMPAMSGGSQAIAGSDVNPLETEGVFTALARIRVGLQNNDLEQVQRAVDMLDTESVDMSFCRAEVAARQQGLDALQTRQDSENVDLQKALSDDYDASLEQVVSDLIARQAAYEASLRATALIFQMSLLNYL